MHRSVLEEVEPFLVELIAELFVGIHFIIAITAKLAACHIHAEISVPGQVSM